MKPFCAARPILFNDHVGYPSGGAMEVRPQAGFHGKPQKQGPPYSP